MRSAVILLAALATAVSAASLQARQNFPPCVATCIGSSAQSAGCNPADASCLCNSEAFINTVAQCFGSSCDATDAAAGTALGQQLCATIGVSVSIPSIASSALAGAGSQSATDAGAVSSASSSGAAAGSFIASSITSASDASASAPAQTSAPASAAPTGAASMVSASAALTGFAVIGAIVAAL